MQNILSELHHNYQTNPIINTVLEYLQKNDENIALAGTYLLRYITGDVLPDLKIYVNMLSVTGEKIVEYLNTVADIYINDKEIIYKLQNLHIYLILDDIENHVQFNAVTSLDHVIYCAGKLQYHALLIDKIIVAYNVVAANVVPGFKIRQNVKHLNFGSVGELKNYYNSSEYSDIKIKINDKIINAHKIILCKSPKLRDIIYKKNAEIMKADNVKNNEKSKNNKANVKKDWKKRDDVITVSADYASFVKFIQMLYSNQIQFDLQDLDKYLALFTAYLPAEINNFITKITIADISHRNIYSIINCSKQYKYFADLAVQYINANLYILRNPEFYMRLQAHPEIMQKIN